VTAFYYPKKGTVTVFVVNQQPILDSPAARALGVYPIPTHSGTQESVKIRAYRTSFSENIKLLMRETRERVPSTTEVDLAPRSLTSIVLCGWRVGSERFLPYCIVLFCAIGHCIERRGKKCLYYGPFYAHHDTPQGALFHLRKSYRSWQTIEWQK